MALFPCRKTRAHHAARKARPPQDPHPPRRSTPSPAPRGRGTKPKWAWWVRVAPPAIKLRSFSWRLTREGGNAGLGATQYQGVDVVGAFIGVDRFQVHHVADHVVLVGDAVAAVHVAGGAGNVERLAAIVALQDRDHLGRVAPFVF